MSNVKVFAMQDDQPAALNGQWPAKQLTTQIHLLLIWIKMKTKKTKVSLPESYTSCSTMSSHKKFKENRDAYRSSQESLRRSSLLS